MTDETMTLEQVHDALQTLLTPTRVKRTDRVALCQRIQSAYESAIAERKAPDVAPVAWLHTVTQDDGETDQALQALSFSPDSFPFDGIAGYRSVSHMPLYALNDAQAAEIARLTAELEKCREDAERLVPHAKWLRECGLELAHDGHYGWANTLTMAADAIDAARRPL